jgi:hypothetical protein
MILFINAISPPSATVGTGNIAGVALAIAIGGPGALFWMWITGLFGMDTKYAEAVVAVKYREKDSLGTRRDSQKQAAGLRPWESQDTIHSQCIWDSIVHTQAFIGYDSNFRHLGFLS